MRDLPAPDLFALFAFEERGLGEFGVSLATLLQCLCIAEQRHLVPPFDPDWERATLPLALRKMAEIDARG
ncbi:uncharacterized protein E1O_12070 [Burkholderiales bacterium GJ-E10]|nr:uncharacterized protein E1O_12070 [Burkholderiales bacterium GJ-E10]